MEPVLMLFELPIVFHSQGIPLVGRVFRNTASLQERQPAVITMGSWLTVKEQMATTYARRLVESGYTTFVFDFSGFGESRGDPRQAEIPARKVADITAAVALLQTLAFVDPERIGCLAICASAQYALRALADGVPIRSYVSVAGWYHDPDSVAPFYGNEPGIAMRLDRARTALDRYARTGDVTMVPAYKDDLRRTVCRRAGGDADDAGALG
jgi:dienelactone hydrolase